MAVEIQAAGGIVTRTGPAGEVELLAIHRDRYDDWSLPKGKLEPGESSETAARREVEEETGWRCELGVELPSVHYVDRHGRPKTVRYWLMTPTEFMGFEPNDEVDEVRWIAVADATTMLSYDADRRLVEHFRSLPP
ncbi:MAG: NUDIX hydrolase [Actinomycetota bacterium]|nr:NUDIX hydrolase [Actinomycetota bacterium]